MTERRSTSPIQTILIPEVGHLFRATLRSYSSEEGSNPEYVVESFVRAEVESVCSQWRENPAVAHVMRTIFPLVRTFDEYAYEQEMGSLEDN